MHLDPYAPPPPAKTVASFNEGIQRGIAIIREREAREHNPQLISEVSAFSRGLLDGLAPIAASEPEFKAWPKIPRLFRDIQITEKIDGTNAAVIVMEDGRVFAQSRKRIIYPAVDNFGFAQWVYKHQGELRELGEGHHYGEWFGQGIQRGYGLEERRFALFNPDRYTERPACCDVVPVLRRCTFNEREIRAALGLLELDGSYMVPGFKRPEGIVVHHAAANQTFKVLLEGDDAPKGVSS